MRICPTCQTQYSGGENFCPVDASRLVTPSEYRSSPPNPADPLIGTTLGGRYKITRRIGEGGMGIVYEAVHVIIEKRFALKVLREDFSTRSNVVARFRQEAKSASRIGHPNIVDISDFGETPHGQSFFVMEYLEGEDLANLLAREGVLRAERATRIALQCCKALGAAHAKGIVHRDMKPENIFLVRREEQPEFVKIVDFGIAKMSDIEVAGMPGRKLTKTGMIFGTPEYMSPEHAAGKPLDHRVDIYAMGIILYEMLVGRVPFMGDSFMGILTQHMFDPPPPMRSIYPNANVSAELETTVFCALAKDPEDRFLHMREMANALSGNESQPPSYRPLPVEGTKPGHGAEPVSIAAEAPRTFAPTFSSDFPHGKRANTALWVAAVAFVVIATLAAFGAYTYWVDVQPLPPPPLLIVDEGRNPDPRVPDAGTIVVVRELDAGFDAGAMRAIARVPVTVETVPRGARIGVEGRGVVCDSTPCTFQADSGVAIVLEAERGFLFTTQAITPNQAMTVVLRLQMRRNRRHPSLRDLKIPPIFQEGTHR